MNPSDTPADQTPLQRPSDAAPQNADRTRQTGSPEWTAIPPVNTAPPTTQDSPGSTANSPFGPGREPPGPADLPQNLQDRYRLIRVLGSGGFANVYLAHDSVLDQPVAIKVLRLGLASQSDRDRFLMEARIGAKLRHPNIVTVFDIVQRADGLQMVMEYYPGGTLTERIRARGPVPARQAIEIARQIAQALAYAHRHSVIHRDVKPANVFLAGEGMVKLGDFGIAAHADHHEFTQTGMIIGTPLYMPPEQSADSRDVDPRTDIYALGLTLYHMLTGRPPRVVDLESIPETFRPLIRQATTPERNERLVSCEQFIAMLDQISLAQTQARRVAARDEQGTQRGLDNPAPSTVSTATQMGQPPRSAEPEETTSTQGAPASVPPPPSAPSIPTPAPLAPKRSSSLVWPLGAGVLLLAAAAGALYYGQSLKNHGGGNVAATSQAGTVRATPTATPAPPAREPGIRSGERPPLPPGVSTPTLAQRHPILAQAIQERQQVRSTPAATPTPTSTASPLASPTASQAQPTRAIGQALSQYLQANPGIASAVEILRERTGAGKPEGMRAFEIRQAQATLSDAIKKSPNDPMLNLIVGDMLQKNGATREATVYFERAVLLDRRSGAPLGLSLPAIREALASAQ